MTTRRASQIALLPFLLCASPLLAGVVFRETSDSVILSNARWQLEISRRNGAITSLIDQSTGRAVSAGSRNGCLWGSYESASATPTYVGGCLFDAAGADRFTYSWDGTARMTLNYSPASPGKASAQVAITTFGDAPNIDFDLIMTNQTGKLLQYALFPSDLVVRESDIAEAYIPVLPGVALEQKFFAGHRSFSASYPAALFADLLAYTGPAGNLAMYSLPTDDVPEEFIGFQHDAQGAGDTTILGRSFGAWVPDGKTWHSPTIRLRIGESLADSLRAFHADCLDRYSTLQQKLGSRFQALAQSPLLKLDAVQIGLPYSSYATAILNRLPGPALLHPVAWQMRGFDENMPDYFPPDPRWGTEQDLKDFIAAAHVRGHLVMPYVNPTLWDDESPTVRGLPAGTTIRDIAVIGADGNPMFEHYGAHTSLAVSPRAPYVQSRNAAEASRMIALGSDFLFEDQIGARGWQLDLNPAARSPVDYMSGWRDHTRSQAGSGLHTERGYDRLLETEIGFHGSYEIAPDMRPDFGNGGWHFYPLATMLFRDRVFLYTHDLAEETFVQSNATLSWDMAAGYDLSCNAADPAGLLGNPWLKAVFDLQRYVIAPYAGQLVSAFTHDGERGQSTTRLGPATITRNLNHTAISVGDDVIAADGFVLVDADHGRKAGIFNAIDTVPLSAGDHVVIFDGAGDRVTVRQPMGSDTDVAIPLSARPTDVIEARAYDVAGNLLGFGQVHRSGGRILLTYARTSAGSVVDRYEVINRTPASRRRAIGR